MIFQESQAFRLCIPNKYLRKQLKLNKSQLTLRCKLNPPSKAVTIIRSLDMEILRMKTVGTGVAIGAGIGTAIGVATGNIGAGVAIGIAIGAAIGAFQQNRTSN